MPLTKRVLGAMGIPAARRTGYLVALLASGGLAACGQQDFSVSEVNRTLEITPEFTDLGVIPVGESVEFSLRLDNVEGGDITIRSVDVTNFEGTNFTLLQDVGTVASGEQAYIDLVYEPGQEGYHRAEINVKCDAEEATVEAEVRGQGAQAVGRVHPSLLDLGPVEVGESLVQDLTVVNESALEFEITDADLEHGDFFVDTELPLVVAAWSEEPLAVGYAPTSEDAVETTLELSTDPQAEGFEAVTLRANDCENGASSTYDQDGDGYATCGGDCDDNDEGVHPGATETWDGVDEDCDGVVDEGTEGYDDDGDGYSENDGDCNDGDAAVSPAAEEDYSNGIDDDCDGTVDSGAQDLDADGYSTDGGDCDDGDDSVNPGEAEVADGVDNDCDGEVDEGTDYGDDDGDGYAEIDGDCDDTDADIGPDATETANRVDDDCDGEVDEGTDYGDDDGDGYTEQGGDCDDTDADVSPAAVEVEGDGVDNDCDGSAD